MSTKPMTKQPTRKSSQSNDLISRIRPPNINKPNLVQHLSRTNPIQVSSGFKILNTRIPSADEPSYHPLVTISDNDESEEEIDFVSPIHKLTKNELREELKIFKQPTDSTQTSSGHALLNGDSDNEETGDIQFRTPQNIEHVPWWSFSLTPCQEKMCIIC